MKSKLIAINRFQSIELFINKKGTYTCKISQIIRQDDNEGNPSRIWLNSVAWEYRFFSVRLQDEAMNAYLYSINPMLEVPKEDIVLNDFFLRKSTTGTEKLLIILSKKEDLLDFYSKREWDKK